MLELNDNILIQLAKNQANGEIHFGLQEDFGDSLLQPVISQFIQQFPNVKLYTQVDRNFNLIQKVEKNSIDFALIWQQDTLKNQFHTLCSADTFWIKHPHFPLDQFIRNQQSIPLVVLNQPCILRQAAIDRLNEKRLPWHIAYECNSLNALWAAVRAGIGISIRSDFAIPKDLEKLGGGSLPDLASFHFGLYHAAKTSSHIDAYFIQCITQNLS